VTGMGSDSLNRIIISSSLDGTVKVDIKSLLKKLSIQVISYSICIDVALGFPHI